MRRYNPGDLVKEAYPRGTRVKLIRCNDQYTNLQPGELGTVQVVDSMGTVHIKWDCGAQLGMILGEDVISPV